MAALQATRYPSYPRHLNPAPQPSIWLVTPMEDPPQPTLGQGMVK